MKPIRYSLSVVVIVAIASLVTAAEERTDATSTGASEPKMFDPANLVWGDAPPGLPAGGQLTVLSGDPTKKGVFTVRLKMPAGYKIPPHTHPTAELVTVISGSCHLGRGEKFDENTGQTMGAGSFVAIPAGAKHFAWATEESVIQIHGEGPFEIKHANPADDPRNAKK